jgi:hypothetical protein
MYQGKTSVGELGGLSAQTLPVKSLVWTSPGAHFVIGV